MYNQLVAAGVSPQAAQYVEEQVEQARQEFGPAAYDELKEYALRATIFGRYLTDDELREAGLQIDADLEGVRAWNQQRDQ